MHRLACALPLLGVFLGAPACSGAEHVAVNETVHDVLILGAGLAGVSAAAYLLNNSDLDVMILEADSMIGGRVHPIKFGSDEVGHVTIERGANWIQGMSPTCDPRNPARQNPMWNFQCEYGMKGMYVPGSEQEVRGLPVVFNGTLLTNTSDKHLAEREDDTMRAYACAERLTESINDTTVSVQDALNKCGWEAKDDIDDVLQWKVSDSDFAAAASDSSLILSLPDASYTEFGPDDWLVVDQNEYGFSKFVHKIIEPAKAAGKLQLELDTNVTEIDYSHTETIKVVSADGRQFHAKQVIVTFSAGVLRHHHRSMFKPSLDPIQSAALEAVPMANFTKIWLQFPKVWWPDEYKCVLLADTCGQDGKIIPWHNLAHPSAIPGSNALLAIVTGEYAGMLDRLSDSELQSVAMERLKCNYPEISIPEPVAFYTSRWSTEPRTLGAYSTTLTSETVETTRCAFGPVKATADSETDRIVFAGEATCYSFPGYTHGSYLSGLLAAHDILHQRQDVDYDEPPRHLQQLVASAEMCRQSPCTSAR